MPAVSLFHWNADEARPRIAVLEAAGHHVIHEATPSPGFLKHLSAHPPQAIVIDLTRLPSHGRDVGLALRMRKSTRGIPLVFVGGDPVKVARIREALPDAVYTEWRGIRAALRKAIASPPASPTVPGSVFAHYSGRPLPTKLGIKPQSTVLTLGAPDGFAQALGALPEGARLTERARGPFDLTLWFVRSREELQAGMVGAVDRSAHGPVWIVWPKQGSDLASDLTQQAVRQSGLASGLVDYKICSIDDTWSGLLFRWRGQSGTGKVEGSGQ